jgi:hypothetical protein
MVGDGKDTCDIFYYQTVVEARTRAVSPTSTGFDSEEFITKLYQLKVIPSWVKRSSISVSATVRAGSTFN